MAKPEKLIELAQAHLEPGERIEAHVAGTYEVRLMGQNTVRSGIFLATDRRLVFYAKKMGGYDFESFPYANISSFEQSKGMMGHSFRFFASGNTVSMKWINDADNFVRFAQLVTERAGHKTPAAPEPLAPAAAPLAQDMSRDEAFAALRQLGELRDAEIITPEEFEAKKKELLGRI
jgi:Bacterial PH domain/Short C-terminal domain